MHNPFGTAEYKAMEAARAKQKLKEAKEASKPKKGSGKKKKKGAKSGGDSDASSQVMM
jgi:hypothetical protein